MRGSFGRTRIEAYTVNMMFCKFEVRIWWNGFFKQNKSIKTRNCRGTNGFASLVHPLGMISMVPMDGENSEGVSLYTLYQ